MTALWDREDSRTFLPPEQQVVLDSTIVEFGKKFKKSQFLQSESFNSEVGLNLDAPHPHPNLRETNLLPT